MFQAGYADTVFQAGYAGGQGSDRYRGFVRVLLVSTYELGHQPLACASPAAALLRHGHEVACLDLAVEQWDGERLDWAEAVAISVPMHTAMRLALDVVTRVRTQRRSLPLCLYGLYAGLGDDPRLDLGDVLLVSGEYEPALCRWADELDRGDAAGRGDAAHAGAAPTGRRVAVELGRGRFSLPARHLLPPLDRYARLAYAGEERLAGYVEASHGCAHRCRHCPVPVVYDGRTRIVDVGGVVDDVAQLVSMGARHITFGDPDFLNGPRHALRVVAATAERFPGTTFDITTKIEHILRFAPIWPELARAGCLFVVSAVESASDEILGKLAKGHTVADVARAVELLRRHGIEMRPSLVPFTPWTTFADLVDLVDLVVDLDLVANVDPVQYAVRLLLPPGSLLLAAKAVDSSLLGPVDPQSLSVPWRSPDPALDELHRNIAELVERDETAGAPPGTTYLAVRAAVRDAAGRTGDPGAERARQAARAARRDERPRLTESWFCCAEPTAQMRASAMLSRGCDADVAPVLAPR
ncbi:MAG: CUAEP/CCAEP-tail radical SAM protein [Actinomycetota bacterium]|nr:CUAEP/CCAEP-tail radical SAM protein [Actinomycetota bacterium]